jgi:hypothetical protein
MFLAIVKNQIDIAMWLHIWGFYSVPLVFMSVFDGTKQRVLQNSHSVFIALAV